MAQPPQQQQFFAAGARPKQKYFHEPDQEQFNNKALDQNMIRRRKKRLGSAGLKTVDVVRGRFGFGFTLSGQNPCILSSVIQGSPAERVGLVSGNCLVAVDGQNVSKMAHSDVVKIISQSSGVLKVSVGDSNNYQSDSSSEEEEPASGVRRPKYPHRRQPVIRRDQAQPLAEISTNQNRDLWLLNNQLQRPQPRDYDYHHQSDTETSRTQDKLRSPGGRHVRSNSADSSFIDINGVSSPRISTPKRLKNTNQRKVELNAGEELSIGSDLNNFFSHNLSELRKSIKLQNHRKLNIDLSSAEYKCVVGYLGTIEMPKGVSQSGGLQEIRNCIRRLRVEKKVHTLVLFCIFPRQVVLINHHGLKLAEFAAENIQFCGVYADDRRFFGLVTSHVARGPEVDTSDSSSCHVFMAEPITSESERQIRANTFQFDLSDQDISSSVQFPANADPVLNVIYKLRGLSPGHDEPQQQPPEQARSSPALSGAALSNSDSGIGYRDEHVAAAQGADRALLVDVQNERIHLQNLTRLQEQQESGTASSRPHPHDVSLSSTDTMPSPNQDSRSAGISPQPPAAASNNNVSSSKLTVRAMPDPDSSFNTDRLESLQSAEHIRQSMQKYLADKHEHLKKTSQQLADKNDKADKTAGAGKPSVERSSVSFTSNSRPTSFVRSLEDLRSVDTGSVYSHPGDTDLGPPSLPANPHLPLARFLYSSDSNLSGLETGAGAGNSVGRLDLANHPLTKWQEARQGSYNKTVLRPCDQYPDLGPVVRRQRDRSAASSTASNRSYRASVHVESSDYDTCSWTRGGLVPQPLHHSLQRKREDSVDMSNTESREVVASSARKPRERRKSDSASIMTDAADAKSVTGSQGGGSPTKEVSRVGSWAADFDKLLNDPAGLQTFAEFLKKEFSHENIYFWCACEKYKSLETGADRLKFAREVMERHLESGASEPVNVDSVANSTTIEQISAANSDNPPGVDLFKTAQTQIYNLMKFDSFSRFLKSELYKESLLADMAGNSLPFTGEDLEMDLMTSAVDLDKSDSSIKKPGEGSRRKSILPWNNMKSRSKSKDRAGVDQNLSTESKPAAFIKKLTGQNSNTGDKSRQSSASFELNKSEKENSDPLNHTSESCDNKESCSLTRFILPDRATTVVSTPSGETIRSLVSRLLDKRGLKYTSFDAFITGNDKPLDLSEDCSTLGCSEVRVEPRVLFRLELPSKKSIGVKAKQTKLVEEVLGPILSQYGWNLADMRVRLDQGRGGVDLKSSVTSIDNTRLVVSHRDDGDHSVDNTGDNESIRSSDSRPNSRSSLSLGQRRASSSSVDSGRHRTGGDGDMMPPPKMIPSTRRHRPPLPAPPLPQPPVSSSTTSPPESDLYEGLKRMTKGRLDDQRGLEINGELPEFLRKPGATVNHVSRASEPFRHAETGRHIPGANSRLSGPAGYLGLQSSDWDRDHAKNYIDYIDSTFTSEGHLPNMAEADEVFTPVNPDESLNFNESRLSLGLGRLSMGSVGSNNYDGMRLVTRPSIGAVRDYDGVMFSRSQPNNPPGGQNRNYEDYQMLQRMRNSASRLSQHQQKQQHRDYDTVNFNSRKDYETLAFRQPPQIAPKPRLSSVDEVPASDQPKRPPPLPPKPVRGPPPLPPHAQHLHNNFGKAQPLPPESLPMGVTRTQNGVYLGMPGEKGYNVSFV